MALNKVYDQYKANSVMTSRPEELTAMLYNGIVKFIMQGIFAIEKNDLEKANESIIRAQDIIAELRNTLDKSYDIANSMDLVYDYMHRRLIEANVHKDTGILNEVLEYAKAFRDTWAEAMKLARQDHIELVK
ncbi:MAG TPA: flagellar export chaperone FliS [Clostridiaceae bacterium]|nr:flagellar export chaperone FliS [Clostridiaceae bacterium]